MLEANRGFDPATSSRSSVVQSLERSKETGRPIVLTINGEGGLVVQDTESYQKLVELVDRLETLEGIRSGLQDMKAGRGRPAEEVFGDIGRELNLPTDV